MKKLLFFLIFSMFSAIVAAQNPEGFNYQAVARDGSGNPIANTTLQVKISILSDTSGFHSSGTGTYIWEEQQGVKTNLSGIFNMVVGNPVATKVQGSATSFKNIDWTQTPLFIGIKIQHPSTSWKNMGTSRLWSVPYSMVSKGIAEGSKVTIVSEDDASTDALFEVKRKDGQTVFAVYNDAVNVYVPDQKTKKAKGGFAVGGFDATKGFSQQYMTVTPDSIRFYINNNPAKGAASKSGFAVGGFDATKGKEKKYLSLFGASTVDTITNASQILWYPQKEAFLAGKIDILNPDSVGRNSFSMGYKNMAIGNYSQALGYQSVARGNYSTAIGRGAIAGPNSFALGNISKALGNDSYALGSGAIASGITSIALGVGSGSSGKASVSIGFKSVASADYSTSLGFYSNANNIYSTAIGYHAFASGPDSYAIGSYAEANGAKSFAIGSYGLNADGTVNESRATWTPGYCSLAFGMGAQATKVGAMSMGVNTTAAGDQSLAMGYEATANGIKSIAIGAHYTVTFPRPVWEWSAAAGKFIITYVPTNLDKQTIADGDYSIAIGNGNYSNNGGMSLGTNNQATAYGSVAVGHSNQVMSEFSFGAGFTNQINGLSSFALGNNLIASSANSFVIGAFNKEEGTINEWLLKDPLFVIGNGSPLSRSNAFAVLKDGNIVLSDNIVSGSGIQLVYDPLDHVMKRLTSSSRYKTNINPLTSIEWLYDLDPVSFKYTSDQWGRTQYGFLAEDMEYVNKDLMFYINNEPDGINYNGLFAPMVKAIQDQKNLIDGLSAKNGELSRENEELKGRLSKLENIVSVLVDKEK
jgi:hypothetical protein